MYCWRVEWEMKGMHTGELLPATCNWPSAFLITTFLTWTWCRGLQGRTLGPTSSTFPSLLELMGWADVQKGEVWS